MIVDDEVEILESFRETAQNACELKCFSDPREAMYDYSRHENYDVVIVDLKMPRKHGESLIFDILLQNPRQKIAVVSGYPEELNLPEEKRKTVSIFEKPISPQKLLKNLFPELKI